jgi:hypothetical protein
VDQPALWQDSLYLGRARLHPLSFVSVCCRKMLFVSNLSSVSVLPWIEEVPLGANFLAVFAYRCQLSSEARFFTVDFPRRCPLQVILSVPFLKEEFAVISRCFKSRYRDFAPNPFLRVKVPNRGVDWSSRPRRACYPWGNFSVTSSPQQ